jgi:hypothetical protein
MLKVHAPPAHISNIVLGDHDPPVRSRPFTLRSALPNGESDGKTFMRLRRYINIAPGGRDPPKC